MESYYDVNDVVKNSIKTLHLEENKVAFYGYFKHRKGPAKYLKVIAKYLNGEGFIITAHFLKTIK